MDFKDQVIIVTGGTRGIGQGITESFLEAGAKVIATYAGNDQAANDFKERSPYKENIILKKFNVADSTACAEFFADITKDFDQIHVLINNAGIRQDNLGASMTEEQWDNVININLKGSFNMTQQAVLHNTTSPPRSPAP